MSSSLSLEKCATIQEVPAGQNTECDHSAIRTGVLWTSHRSLLRPRLSRAEHRLDTPQQLASTRPLRSTCQQEDKPEDQESTPGYGKYHAQTGIVALSRTICRRSTGQQCPGLGIQIKLRVNFKGTRQGADSEACLCSPDMSPDPVTIQTRAIRVDQTKRTMNGEIAKPMPDGHNAPMPSRSQADTGRVSFEERRVSASPRAVAH